MTVEQSLVQAFCTLEEPVLNADPRSSYELLPGTVQNIVRKWKQLAELLVTGTAGITVEGMLEKTYEVSMDRQYVTERITMERDFYSPESLALHTVQRVLTCCKLYFELVRNLECQLDTNGDIVIR